MADESTIGLGATIAVNDGSGGAGSASAIILDVFNLGVPDPTVGSIESKKLNLSNRTITKKPALKDGGEFTFQYEHSAGKKTRLDTLLGSPRVFVITLPDAGDGATWVRTAPGFITSNKIDPVVADQMMTCTATVMVSGAVS